MDVHKILEGIYNELKKIFKSEESDSNKKQNKYPNFLIICLSLILIGILIVLSTDYFKNSSTVSVNPEGNKAAQEALTQSAKDYEEIAESKLKSILEDMEGVGRAKVMITIEGSEEQVPAINVTDSSSTTKEKDDTGGTRETVQENNGSTVVITNDGSKSQPLIVQTKKPKIIGICIIAEGAKDKAIQLQIIEVVTRLYNLTPDKVSVYPMKK